MGIRLQADTFLKVFLLFALLLGVAFQEGYSQTNLSSGDIAITTVNTSGDKSFDFIPLVNLEANTTIKFTNAPYIDANSALDNSEGTLTYTTANAISAGTVISYPGSDVNGFKSTGDFNPAASGDNIIVFQGDRSNPTYLYGIGWASTDNWVYEGDTTTSDVPPTLSESANTIVNLEAGGNYQYNDGNGTRGTVSSLLKLIGNDENWVQQEDQVFSSLSESFTLLTPPTVAFSESTIDSSEGSGKVELSVGLVESNNTEVEVEVVFISNSSTATNGNDFSSYTTQTIKFDDEASNGAIKKVAIDLTDDDDFEGDETAVFQLQNASVGTIIEPDVATLTIKDDDAPNIVINEVLYDPSDAGNKNRDATKNEFVEFVNNSVNDVDISNWTLSNNEGAQFSFPSGTIIPVGHVFVVFTSAPKAANFGGAFLFIAGSLQFNSNGDSIILKDDQDNKVTSFSFSGAESEESLTRNPDITGSFEGHTSADSDDNSSSSPGRKVDGTAFGSKYALGLRGSAGWRLVSTPTKNTSFKDLFGDVWIQGISNSDDEGAEFKNIVGWDEAEKQFINPNSVYDNMIPGRGYAIYVYDDARVEGEEGGFPKVINTNNTDGTVNEENTSPVTVNVSANDADQSGSIDGSDEGWNLLGNPYGAEISVDALFTALKDANPNVNANIAVWDDDKTGGPGYIQLQEGDQEYISPFEAFWVRYEVDGVNTNVTLNKEELASNQDKSLIESSTKDDVELDLTLHGEEGYFDTFTLAFSQNGNTNLNRFDAYQLTSLDINSINLFSIISDKRITTKELPNELETGMEFPLSYSANGRNQLTFKWDINNNIPSDWGLTLIDKEVGREIDLRSAQEYSFSVNSNAKLKAVDEGNRLNKSSEDENGSRFVLAIDPNLESQNNTELPGSIKLNPNYPNPFNPTTTIPYEITEDAEVRLTVWNMIGQKVATLVDGMVEAGTHEETWNAQSMPSGIYIARFEVNGNVFTRKMTLIK